MIALGADHGGVLLKEAIKNTLTLKISFIRILALLMKNPSITRR